MAAGFWTFGIMAADCCSMQYTYAKSFPECCHQCLCEVPPPEVIPTMLRHQCLCEGQHLQQALEFSAVMQQHWCGMLFPASLHQCS